MASNKTSSSKKKARNTKKSTVATQTKTSSRKRKTSSSSKTRKPKKVEIQEITEQISILEVVSDSAVAAKPFLLAFAVFFCLYLGLALMSFEPTDVQAIASGEVANWGGVLGVLLSSKLYTLLGYGSWVVLPIGALCAWLIAGRRLLPPLKMVGITLLYWNLLCVLSLLNTEPTSLGFYTGGSFGHSTVTVMTKMIGTGGSWLLLSALSVVLIIVVAGMELREIVERSLQRIEEQGPDLGHRSLHWGQEVLFHLKDNSLRLADSLRDKFSRRQEVDEDQWYDDESFFDGEYHSEYTDDGTEYTEEDSFPPESFEAPSEYEYSESCHSEDYSYDLHTQKLHDEPQDVTRTQVQSSTLVEAEFSEAWYDQDDSTFDPNPMIRQPEPVASSRLDSVKPASRPVFNEETLTDASTGSVPSSQPHRVTSNPFPPMSERSKPRSSVATAPVPHLPQEEIELPEDAWAEDLSEWYLTDKQSIATSSLSVPKGKLSALPSEPLTAELSIRRPLINGPEVGSVAEHLGADSVDTAELSSDESGLYDLPKPVAAVQQSAPPKRTGPCQAVEAKKTESASSRPVSTQSPSTQQTSQDVALEQEVSIEDTRAPVEQKASKPNSVSQLVEQVDSIKSQAREQASQQSVSNTRIPLPEREVTPAMGMEMESYAELDLDEDSESEFGEATPARAMVNPGNIETGGDGEVHELTNPYADFVLPSLDLLDVHEKDVAKYDEDELMELADILVDKLADFKVLGEVETICPGPVITTFEFKPARGVRVSKIANLSDDIAMALRAVSIRIVAPIPGKDVVGIEIPNQERQTIWSRDMLGSKVFQESKAILPMALGKDVNGFPYVTDLTKTPHLLVAGTTGSGKSVGVNTMLVSMLLRHSPETLRLILVDPKMLEFEMYNNIPHLLHPVVTDPHQASGILQWACNEMDRRYAMMAKFKTRNIESFNQRLTEEMANWDQSKAVYYAPEGWDGKSKLPKPKKMPYIVVVIDELADLMMVAGKEVEESIIRIAQKARACGIHLIVATQRPSADVVTGLIKANMPSRICFQVRGRNDSRIILDNPGGETLLGRGDMLYLPPGIANLVRCHGPFLTDNEVRRITDHLRAQGKPNFEAEVITKSEEVGGADEYDELYDQAVEFVCEKGYASTSAVQRQFRIGYNRAARMIEQMERDGIISEQNGSKKRKILRNSLEP